MPIAREGTREILAAAGAAALVAWLVVGVAWPLALAPAILWLWVVSFFRDPPRRREYEPGDICAAADGTVTEIAELEAYDLIDGPAVRIGVFLSLFNVHVNRSPCGGVVRSVVYKPGEFLDARHPESGARNEANTLVIDPDPPLPGPVVVRQVAGLVARRIICHVGEGQRMPIGYRFGLIKFGSRTEVIIPRRPGTEINVSVGDKVRGGLTILARQPLQRTTAP